MLLQGQLPFIDSRLFFASSPSPSDSDGELEKMTPSARLVSLFRIPERCPTWALKRAYVQNCSELRVSVVLNGLLKQGSAQTRLTA